jgi:hypothetical protein
MKQRRWCLDHKLDPLPLPVLVLLLQKVKLEQQLLEQKLDFFDF